MDDTEAKERGRQVLKWIGMLKTDFANDLDSLDGWTDKLVDLCGALNNSMANSETPQDHRDLLRIVAAQSACLCSVGSMIQALNLRFLMLSATLEAHNIDCEKLSVAGRKQGEALFTALRDWAATQEVPE